jgi:hypothetical protein
MPAPKIQPAIPHWYFIPVRILLVTFLLALLSFAISLLLGIVGIVISSHVRGIHPNMTVAYRHIALPVSAVAAGIAMIATTVMEIRNYRQTKILAEVARASR